MDKGGYIDEIVNKAYRQTYPGNYVATGGSALVTAGLPETSMTISPGNTALVITDPQNDFLSPKGVTWGVVGKSVTDNNTVKNIEKLLKAAKKSGIPVFISPHYYFPTDMGGSLKGHWKS